MAGIFNRRIDLSDTTPVVVHTPSDDVIISQILCRNPGSGALSISLSMVAPDATPSAADVMIEKSIAAGTTVRLLDEPIRFNSKYSQYRLMATMGAAGSLSLSTFLQPVQNLEAAITSIASALQNRYLEGV